MMLRILLTVCFVAACCLGIQAQGKTSDELIKILTAPHTSRKARKQAAARLAQKPPREVLPKLLEVQRKYGATISDWGLDAFDMGYEVTWEQAAAVTAGYAWSGNLDNPSYSKEEKGLALLDLMKLEKTASGRAGFLNNLKFYWVDGAEVEAAAILGDSNCDSRSRYTAADVLLGLTAMKYYDQTYSAALVASSETQEWFARLLLSKKAPEWEARVLRYAFTVIQTQRRAHPDRPGYGYFLASAVGSHVGTEFVPDQSDPKYKGENGLKDTFFIETVENALRWWEENKSAYSQ
jgi:hypothetical protein